MIDHSCYCTPRCKLRNELQKQQLTNTNVVPLKNKANKPKDLASQDRTGQETHIGVELADEAEKLLCLKNLGSSTAAKT